MVYTQILFVTKKMYPNRNTATNKRFCLINGTSARRMTVNRLRLFRKEYATQIKSVTTSHSIRHIMMSFDTNGDDRIMKSAKPFLKRGSTFIVLTLEKSAEKKKWIEDELTFLEEQRTKLESQRKLLFAEMGLI